MDRTHADDDRPEIVESALGQDDEQRALDHKLDRMAPSRRAVWPKDDRRSSERLSGSERPRSPKRRSGDLPEGGPPLG